MCGICGFVSNMLNKDKEITINKMMDKMLHRGPDERGKYTDSNVALGFRRLSIIDLEEGSQPIFNEDGSKILIFNGEIYNYKDIRKDLIKKGHKFKSNVDSEVVLHLYEEYGSEMFQYIRGMFAFVIWDSKTNTLFGARDFFGIKPLYYSKSNNNFIFASEIKSIIEHPNVSKEVNLEALETYLTFQYFALEESFFKGIYKIPQGHYFIFKENKLEIKQYWEPDFQEEDDKSLDELLQEFEKIEESIQLHKVSDVEVGSFLSSGIDSSYIAVSSKKNKTFSVGFKHDNYNEVKDIKEFCNEVNLENYEKNNYSRRILEFNFRCSILYG